jgi:hypothetical protein
MTNSRDYEMELMCSEPMLASRLLFKELREGASRDAPLKRGGPQLNSLGHQMNGRVNGKAFSLLAK